MLTPYAGTVIGNPAWIEAWRAGFCPWPAVKTWPKMTSEMSVGSMLDRRRTSRMTTVPRSLAGVVERVPMKVPTAVRAALTITTVVAMLLFLW